MSCGPQGIALRTLPEARVYTVAVEEKEKAEQELSDTALMYKTRNSQIVNYFRNLLPARTPIPPAQNYMQILTGIGGVHFEWRQHRHGDERVLDVAIDFETGDKKRNQEYCDSLKRRADVLTKVVGESLVFEPDRGPKWAYACARRNCEPWSDEIAKWAAEKMVALMGCVEPLLQEKQKSTPAAS